MNVKPLIIPTVIPSALPENIIRRLNKKNKILKPDTFITELTENMYFSFLIEEIRDHEIKQMFLSRLGGTVLNTVPPDLNDIIVGGTLPEWKNAFNLDIEVFDKIYKLFLATPMKEFFKS